jgi:hypothetical protein
MPLKPARRDPAVDSFYSAPHSIADKIVLAGEFRSRPFAVLKIRRYACRAFHGSFAAVDFAIDIEPLTSAAETIGMVGHFGEGSGRWNATVYFWAGRVQSRERGVRHGDREIRPHFMAILLCEGDCSRF